MKKIKSIYIVFVWLAISIIATILKLTHNLNTLTEILFSIVFILSIIILIKIWTRISPQKG